MIEVGEDDAVHEAVSVRINVSNSSENRGGEDGLLVVLPAEVDVFLVDLDEDSTRGEKLRGLHPHPLSSASL